MSREEWRRRKQVWHSYDQVLGSSKILRYEKNICFLGMRILTLPVGRGRKGGNKILGPNYNWEPTRCNPCNVKIRPDG